MMIRRFGVAQLRTLAAAAGMVGIIGCGSEESSTKKATSATATAKAAAATVPDELVGTWFTRLQPSASSYLEPGKYTMKIHPNGNVDMYLPKGDTAKDCLVQKWCEQLTVKASGTTLTIIETTDCTFPAQYSYKLTGNKLTTKQVEDTCGAAADRPRLYNGTTWRRQDS